MQAKSDRTGREKWVTPESKLKIFNTVNKRQDN